MRAPILVAGAALALLSLPAVASAEPVVLSAHRAVYDLKLDKASGSRAPASVRGRIVYNFAGSECEGYSTSFRQVTEIVSSGGDSRLSDMTSATFEDGDGSSLRFTIKTRNDNAPAVDVDGDARRTGGGALSIALTRPTRDKIDLAQDVVFPTEHLRRIIAAARDGQTTLAIKVFDGSDTGHKIYDTLSVIGRPATDEPAEKAAQDPALAHLRRWPVSISFFDSGKPDGAPDYVLGFDLYENGVSRALKLDYGDFSLTGELMQFTALPGGSCTK